MFNPLVPVGISVNNGGVKLIAWYPTTASSLLSPLIALTEVVDSSSMVNVLLPNPLAPCDAGLFERHPPNPNGVVTVPIANESASIPTSVIVAVLLDTPSACVIVPC